MGSRGPIPDPKSERSKTGRNTRSRPAAATPDGVQPPAWLADNAVALAFWNTNAPILAASGRLALEHVHAFAMLCELHADTRLLADQVAAEGFITATDKGQAASPVAKLLRDARRDFVTLARDFGLTAAASARIPQESPDGEEEGDEETKLLQALSLRGRA